MRNTAKRQPRAVAPKGVFIVDDHPVFREGLVQILREEADLTVCGQAGDADEALRAIPRLKPDLVLVDISLPGRSGLDLIKEVRKTDRGVKLLVVSMHDEALYADRVLRAGGDGFIMKEEGPEEIVQAIHDVLDGDLYVSEEVLKGPAERPSRAGVGTPHRSLDQLTDPELEILELLGRGKDDKQIARRLRLNVRNVVAGREQIRRKLKMKSLNELICYASTWVQNGAV